MDVHSSAEGDQRDFIPLIEGNKSVIGTYILHIRLFKKDMNIYIRIYEAVQRDLLIFIEVKSSLAMDA
jgi:hypothetical protein